LEHLLCEPAFVRKRIHDRVRAEYFQVESIEIFRQVRISFIEEKDIDVLVINTHSGLFHLDKDRLVTPLVGSCNLDDDTADDLKIREPKDLDRVLTLLLVGSTMGTSTFLTAAHLEDDHIFPRVPTTLFFAFGCSAGWTTDLASAVIHRGCRFFIGHRVVTDSARSNHREFFTLWHERGLDPDLIPEVFCEWACRNWISAPVLYTSGTGHRLRAIIPAGRRTFETERSLEKFRAAFAERIDELETVEAQGTGSRGWSSD